MTGYLTILLDGNDVTDAHRRAVKIHRLLQIELLIQPFQLLHSAAGTVQRGGIDTVSYTHLLLQEDDVRNDLGTCVLFESVIGQTDGPQQFGALSKIPAHGGILGVHRVAAGDKGHHATGTNLIQSLGEKVVVNAEIQLVIGFIPNLIRCV